MKGTILLPLILLLNLYSFSTNIEWSETIQSGRKAPAPIVIGQDDNHIFLIRYASSIKLFIEKYKADDLTSRTSVQFESKYNDKKLELISAQMINKKPIIFTSFYNKKEKLVYFFAQKIEKKELSIGKPILLGHIPKFMVTFYTRGNSSGSKFNLSVSENGNSAFSLFPQSTNGQPSKNYKSILLNDNLEKQASTEVSLPYLPQKFKVLNKQLGNDGLYYILGYNTIEGKKKGIFRMQETFRDNIYLYAIDPHTGNLNSTIVEIDQELIQMSMKVSNRNGTIAVIGLTSLNDEGVNGSVCIVYDNQLNELNRTLTPFEESFVTKTYSDREKNKLEKEKSKADKSGNEGPKAAFYKYYIDHIIESPNGSFTVFAEQYYIIVRTYTSTNANGSVTTYSTYHYYYNDIIVVNYDRDGRFQWKNLVEKQQHSTNDGGFYSSYLPIKNGNNIGIIFNTKEIFNLENTDDLSRSDRKKASRKTICMNITLTPEGDINSEELFRFEKKDKFKIAPKYSSQLSNGDVVIYAHYRSGRKIGIIKL